MKSTTMAGRTVLVTGATTGIGRATAVGLATMGAHVAITGRDRGRAEDAAREVRAAGGGQVEVFVADLSSQVQVRRLAGEVLGRLPRIDVLVNNVGGYWDTRHVTADGLERTFALNDLQGERSYSGSRAYDQSKLANVLFSYELARRLRGSGVTANALHPGMVSTSFGAEDPGRVQRVLVPFLRPFLKSPARGAATSIHLASDPDVAPVSGRYFAGSRPRRTSARSYDEDVAARLWAVSADLVGQTAAARG